MTHKRNTASMLSSPRCGAHSRTTHGPCRAPAVRGKKRCRMHGGATGSGAPKNNKNALVHGSYTRDSIAENRKVTEMIRQANDLMKIFEALPRESEDE